MATQDDPRPLTRAELAKFLPNQRAIRAFERLFDLIPTDIINLDERLQLIENPAVSIITTDSTLTTDAYIAKVTVNGLTITLPQGGDEIRGRVWAVILASEGPLTIKTSIGDSIPMPSNPAETTLVLKAGRRGSTIALRYLGDNVWGFA